MNNVLKSIAGGLCVALCVSGCTFNSARQADGTMAGAMIGGAVGSLFGGISDGPRGNWWGTAIGTVAGAALGNALNNTSRKTVSSSGYRDAAASEIYTSPDADTRTLESSPEDIRQNSSTLEIQNIRLVDENHDLKINPGEQLQLIFEIHNYGENTVYNVVPDVNVDKQQKRFLFSRPVRIEQVNAGTSLRYTLSMYATPSLKEGDVGMHILLSVENSEPRAMSSFTLSCVRIKK